MQHKLRAYGTKTLRPHKMSSIVDTSSWYIGIMSGTSVDGLDVTLVDFESKLPKVLAHHFTAYPSALRNSLLDLSLAPQIDIARYGLMDVYLGELYADAVNELLNANLLQPKSVRAIGSHGQTVRHLPHQRYTCQLGDPNVIAARTGITTVADFRRKDLALGGQGAPLVPAFHHYLVNGQGGGQHDTVIVNIGGIANVTILTTTGDDIIGYDTGPGNTLLDAWINYHQKQPYDQLGQWAECGQVNTQLLQCLLSDPYFSRSHPKSTGREYFNLDWLRQKIALAEKLIEHSIAPVDVQRTLVELTAASIINAVQIHSPRADVLICGGGAANAYLMKILTYLGGSTLSIHTTDTLGIPPQLIESVAFAWLACQTIHKRPGNLPSVTGASKQTILGAIYYA